MVRPVRLLFSLLVLPFAAAATCPGNGNGNGEEPPVDPCAAMGICPDPGNGAPSPGSDGGIEIIDDGLPDPPPDAWLAFEAEVTTRVNALRAAGGVCGTSDVFPPAGPLRVDARLIDAARAHGRDMATQDYFAHESLDGRTPFDRMDDAGYTAFAAAENLAAGQRTPAEVVEGWRTSPGHCRNLYDGDLNEVGVGYIFDAASTYQHYWVQNFGIRQ
jgi:uncharacterized protein YkwD